MQKNNLKKSCTPLAIDMGRDSRLLDHIAPISALLDIPLLLTDEANYELAQKYYPKTKTRYVDHAEFTLFDLAKEYDLFLQCTFWNQEMTSFFKGLYPHLRFAYCPHGNSDKGHQKPMMEEILRQDIVFLYGEHMIERLKKQNLWEKIPPHALTGNYRHAFYRSNQAFYDDLAQKEVFSKLNPDNPTILYAPTWNDEESSTSFYAVCKQLLSQLPKHYNLILKIHPLLEDMDPAAYYAALPAETDRDNFLLLKDFPTIFPLLAETDIYLGDTSSIGYDFLYFQKPMFFFNPFAELQQNHPSLFLYQCGLAVTGEDIFGFIEKNLSYFDSAAQNRQKKIAAFAFGKEKPAQELKADLLRAYTKTF